MRRFTVVVPPEGAYVIRPEKIVAQAVRVMASAIGTLDALRGTFLTGFPLSRERQRRRLERQKGKR
jgi:hypothetical protein